MDESITFKQLEDSAQEFLDMPYGPLKNIKYNTDVRGHQYTYGNTRRVDGKIYVSYTVYTMKRGKQTYYLKVKSRTGFTLNEKGKLSIWFGKPIYDLHIFLNDVFKALHIDWVKQLPANYYHFISKTTLEKMLNGKITNPIEFCAQLLKNMKAKASPRLLYQVFMQAAEGAYTNKVEAMHLTYTPHVFNRGSMIAKNFDHFLQFLYDKKHKTYGEGSLMQDLEEQALILDRKIDYNWSELRMRNEHENWTRELMMMQSHNLSTDVFPNIGWFSIQHSLLNYEGITLVDNEKELFLEGTLMSHCVYTNYRNKVVSSDYIVLSIDYKGERATAGIAVYENGLSFDQVFGKRNTSPSEALKSHVISYYEALNSSYRRELQTTKVIPLYAEPNAEQIQLAY